MSHRPILFLSIILSFSLMFDCAPKSDALQKKLIVLDKSPNTTQSPHHLVSYNFEDGINVSKDTLCTFKTSIDQYEIFSLYKNRYIISEHGFIFDLQTKKVLLNTADKRLSCTGDSLIYSNHDYINIQCYAYNLKTNRYTQITNSAFSTEHTIYETITISLSPDTKLGLKSIGALWPQRSEDLKIALYDSSSIPQTIIKAGGMGTYQSHASSIVGNIPFYWLDNSIFIYAKYLYPEVKYRTNIEIHKVNIHTKSDQRLCMIDTVKGTVGDALFYRDALGNLLLQHGNQSFQLNRDLTQIHPIDFEQKGQNFELEVGAYKKKLEIKHNNISLGKFSCYSPDVRATENYIAWNSHNGISIWNAYTNECSYLPSAHIIDWLK